MTGGFHSAHVAAISSLAQQRRVPYLIDITAADSVTANIAKSVREGQQKVQYVYRNFPSSVTFGKNAIKYMTDVFREAHVSPKRVVVMYTNDLFGKTATAGFEAAHKAANPGFDIVEVIPFPETAADLSTEVSRARAAKPDVIAPFTRPVTAISLIEEIAKQRLDIMGVISPGAPGLYEPGQIKQLKELIEYVMDAAPWPNYKSANGAEGRRRVRQALQRTVLRRQRRLHLRGGAGDRRRAGARRVHRCRRDRGRHEEDELRRRRHHRQRARGVQRGRRQPECQYRADPDPRAEAARGVAPGVRRGEVRVPRPKR